jgi:hypothetical protein
LVRLLNEAGQQKGVFKVTRREPLDLITEEYERNYPNLKRYLMTLTRDAPLAEDIINRIHILYRANYVINPRMYVKKDSVDIYTIVEYKGKSTIQLYTLEEWIEAKNLSLIGGGF